MRNILIKSLAGAVLLTVAGVTANAQTIDGTAHDLEVALGTEGICTYCHTPHSAASDVVPLWDRDTATTVWTSYDSGSLDATVGDPHGVSLACLSCHDGATAYNSLAGGVLISGGNTATMSGTKAIGTTGGLADDHPVSMDYSTGGLGLVTQGTGVVGALPLYSTTLGAVGTDVECATCHSVHDNQNGSFLRMANTNSNLCTNCHVK